MRTSSVTQSSPINPNFLLLSPHLNIDPDVLLSNGNGIFCAGTQGTGKSVILKLIMEQVAQKVSAPIVAFDREQDLLSVIEYFPRGVVGTYRNCPTARDIYADGLQVVYDLSTWPDMDVAGAMMARMIFQLINEADSLPFNLRVPCLVVADEASYWLPQNRRVSRLDEEVLANLHNAFETLASRGRKRGLVPTLFTQRFSHVAKDVLSPGTYILMRQIVHTEQQRYLDYVLPVDEFYYFTDRQKKQRIADLKPGEAIVKLATGEQIVTQFYKCKSEHAAHTPKAQAARNRYEHIQFEHKSYGGWIEDKEMDLHATTLEPSTVQHLSKSTRIRQLLEQDRTMKSADIARLVDCDPSMVSRERTKYRRA
jgi:hypothetical protein